MRRLTGPKLIISGIAAVSIVGVALAFWVLDISDGEVIQYDETYTTQEDFERWVKEHWQDGWGEVPDAGLKPLVPEERWCHRIPEENRAQILRWWTQVTYEQTKIYIPPTC